VDEGERELWKRTDRFGSVRDDERAAKERVRLFWKNQSSDSKSDLKFSTRLNAHEQPV